MLPFFRKIRYRLAQDNQFFKYSKYAIGEIALVVIGILIALQINNWNEDRKTAKQEIKILNDLKNDLETNLKEISETYKSTNQRQKSIVLILDYFENAMPVDDSLKKAFESLEQDVIFNIANTSYKFIESQGINSLSNDSLRIRVTEMYERHLTNIVTRENLNRQMVSEELIPFMQEHFVSTATVDKDNLIALEALNMPKNIEDLRDDSVFKNIIVRLQTWFLVRLKWQRESRVSLEQLILDVRQEIDRLSNLQSLF